MGTTSPAESQTTDAVSHSTQRAAAFVRVLSLIG